MPSQERRLSRENRRNGNDSASISPTMFFTATSLVLFLILGGGPISANVANLIMLFGGACCLLIVGSKGGLSALRQLPAVELLTVVAVVTIPLIQLVPFPPSLWNSLPGRETENALLHLAGLSSSWLPITLDRAATMATVAFALAFGGLFLAGLSLREADLKRLLILMVCCTVLSIALGAIQLSTSGQLTLYPSSHRGLLLGFFANRNHQSLFLAVSILTIAYLVSRSGLTRRRALILFGFCSFIGLAAAFGTASRMGLALCLLAVAGGPLVFLDVQLRRRMTVFVTAIGVAALIALINISQVASGTLTRYGDVTADYRWTIWQRSVVLMRDYFPVGTGIGAYADVFKKYERLEWLRPQYVNAAHNDYIQLMVETGMLGLILLLLLGVILVRSAHFNFGEPGAAGRRDAGLARLGLCVIALVLIHSLVDYPLRRPAIGAIFALSLAFVLRQRIAVPTKRRYTARHGTECAVDS